MRKVPKCPDITNYKPIFTSSPIPKLFQRLIVDRRFISILKSNDIGDRITFRNFLLYKVIQIVDDPTKIQYDLNSISCRQIL